MPLYRGELPGMVWDPVKKRYFAIQSSSNATNLQYTVAALRALKAQLEEQTFEATTSEDLKLQTVIRKRLDTWESARLNGSYNRSTRSRPNALSPVFPFSTTLSRLFTQDDKGINVMMSGFPWQNASYPASLGRIRYVDAFDYDNVTGTLSVGHSTGQPVNQDTVMYHHDVKTTQPGWPKMTNLALVAGNQITGMAMLPGMREVIVTCGTDFYPAIIHIQPPPNPYVSTAGLVFALQNLGSRTVRSFAVSPFDTTVGTFAVGTNYGILIPDLNNHLVQKYQTKDESSGEALACAVHAAEFLDHNTFLGGMDFGRIRLWDFRSEESVFRIGHPSSVRSLKRADCTERVIVRGCSGHLSMYDLRFVKEEQNWPAMSRPYLKFPEQDRSATNRLGIDVSTELGLLAVGNWPSRLSLFNLKTAKSEGSIQIQGPNPPLTMGVRNNPVHTIRFKNDEKGTPMMMVTNGGWVSRLML